MGRIRASLCAASEGLTVMKISELLNEAPPGVPTEPTSKIGKFFKAISDKKTDFDMSRSVKKAYGFWIDHVKKMSTSGYDMNDPEKYLGELSRWMRSRLHIPPNSKILADMTTYLKTNGITDQTINKAMFDAVKSASTSTERGMRYSTRSGPQMQTLMGQIIPLIAPLTAGLNSTQKQELFNFVAAKVAADNSINDPREIIRLAQDHVAKISSGNPPPSIVSGQTAKAGGVEYVWNGSEWRNSTTGAVATAPIAAALTASITGGNP